MLFRSRGVFTTAILPITRTAPIGTPAGFGTRTSTCGPGCPGMDFSTARLDIRSSRRVTLSMPGTADSDIGADSDTEVA